jgi:RNA polymerase sigma-70 factor (sigma-E family)
VKDDRREAFEQFCSEEYAQIVRTAYLITGDREEALDLAQEAFARAYERWRSVSEMDRPGAWVQRVAVNLAISWRRRQRLRTRRQELDATAAPDDRLVVGTMSALDQLTPAQRAVGVLRYFGDQSIEDTARALGKRPGTVRALTSQALARLRSALASEEMSNEA